MFCHLFQTAQGRFMNTASAQTGEVLAIPRLPNLCMPFPWQDVPEVQQICRAQLN